MLKKYFYAVILLLAVVGISACCKKRLYCESGSLNIAFVGFPRMETRTLLIKKFNRYEDIKAVDSGFFIYAGKTPSQTNKIDTLWLSDYVSNNGMSNRLTTGYDWRITLTGVDRSYDFNEIVSSGKRYEIVGCNEALSPCIDELARFNFGGTTLGGNTVYIRR